ncbi:MAG TPA: PEGA domain-containing protein [Vicinamibacterales bacterium]|nr:PEGA domain-containing protein [Vicinamibacterales bacterium]
MSTIVCRARTGSAGRWSMPGGMLRSASCREGVSPLTSEGPGQGSVPTAFGPFRVLHQLGAGTLGPVFRAHDAAEGRLVAVKAFRLDLTQQSAARVAASLDDLVGRALNHPTITTPIAAGLECATPWLAQIYVAAEPLDGALRQFGPAPIAHVVALATHVGGALDFAAAAGVLHGSLHPRDILVAPGETFLIDVGVAPALERCGIRTPVRRPYTAPERIDGAPASRSADVFALAAIAFELLTGQPIAGAGGGSLAQLPDIPGADAEALRAAFASALAAEPGARPPTALSFAASLKNALGAAAFLTTPARAPRKPQRAAVSAAVQPAAEDGIPSSPSALSTDAREDVDRSADAVVEAATPAPQPAAVRADHTIIERPDAAPATEAFLSEESPRVPDAVETAPARFSDVADDGEDVAAASVRELPDTFRRDPSSVRATPPLAAARYQPATRSLPVSVVLVVLAAALTGFGVGWLWSELAPFENESSRAGQPTAPARSEPAAIAEPEPAAPVDGAGEEPGAAVTQASTGVEPAPAAARERTRAAAAAANPARNEAAPAPIEGRLLVRSTPAGAIVQIDGRLRGRTPLSVRDLALGSHTVLVSRPGYEPERRSIQLTRERASRTLDVELERAEVGPVRSASGAYTGTMVVESRPRDARVVLDGTPVGRTPLTLPSVRAGSHVVRIELDGYRTWTGAVRVVAGERNRVTASLEQLE